MIKKLFSSKKQIIIISAILVGVITVGVLLTVFLLNRQKQPVISPSSSISSSSEEISSEEASSEETSSEDTPQIVAPEIKLSVTAPKSSDITVNVPYYTIKGSGEKGKPLLINGTEIAMDETGLFFFDVSLAEGENTFTISHKDQTLIYKIRYKKIIIKEIYPSSKITVESASDLTVSATALKDSSVTASFNGQSINLYQADNDENSASGEYAVFYGSFKMPVNTGAAKSYGKISFTAISSSGNGYASSGAVTVKTFDASKYDGGNGYPAGSKYLNVGTTYIAEVVCSQAETFNASDATDLSRPTNNYLPKGTVDYCSPYTKSFRYSGNTIELYTLRYGKQLYKQTENTGTNIQIYEGVLPEKNNVRIASGEIVGRHTVLAFDVDWKAPFTFEYLPQAYKNTSSSGRDYAVTEATFSYIDITFAYAETLDALLDWTDNPIFSHSEVFQNEYDCTLRLYLKNTGKFYGWNAEYNEQGQLEFRFLNPVELKTAENEFGYSLEGVTVVVDAGHGGKDCGATGFLNGTHEAQLNLSLAKELEKQLKELGATVVMTRSEDIYVSAIDRISTIKEAKPDFMISVHRNAASNSKASGFSTYYFNPFSAAAANAVFEATDQKELYKYTAWSFVRWHVFFLCRVTDCPTVLTENGFVSNRDEYNAMLGEEQHRKCASALIEGMIKYFNS